MKKIQISTGACSGQLPMPTLNADGWDFSYFEALEDEASKEEYARVLQEYMKIPGPTRLQIFMTAWANYHRYKSYKYWTLSYYIYHPMWWFHRLILVALIRIGERFPALNACLRTA
jgi:hypothetical protein